MKVDYNITSKGNIKLLGKAFGEKDRIIRLLGRKKDYTVLLADEMKDVIKGGKVLRRLRPSTIKVRKLRGQGQKPLFATGELYNSIKGTKTGVTMLKYGTHQAEGFVPAYVPATNKSKEPYINQSGKYEGKVALKPNNNEIEVPSRNFLVAINSPKTAKSIQKLISKNMPKMIKKIMKVGIKTKF